MEENERNEVTLKINVVGIYLESTLSISCDLAQF